MGGGASCVPSLARPADRVSRAAHGLGGDSDRSTVTVGRNGSFSVDVPLSFGANVITVAVTARDGSMAYERRTVTSDLIQGDTLPDVSDPLGDDYGPGRST